MLQVLKLKSKILTCSEESANKYDQERAEPCANGQRCLMIPPAKLSLILGMDIHHVQPKLVDKFSEKHGFLGLYACSLSNTLIICGNRVYPYSPEEARSALAQHTNGFGVATEDAADLEEDNFSSLLDDDTGVYNDDQEEFEKVHLEIIF